MNQHRDGSRICLNLVERFLEPVKKDGIRLGVRGAWLPTGTHYGYLNMKSDTGWGDQTIENRQAHPAGIQLTCSTRTKSLL